MNIVLLAQSVQVFVYTLVCTYRIFTRTRRNGKAAMASHWSTRDIQF